MFLLLASMQLTSMVCFIRKQDIKMVTACQLKNVQLVRKRENRQDSIRSLVSGC